MFLSDQLILCIGRIQILAVEFATPNANREWAFTQEPLVVEDDNIFFMYFFQATGNRPVETIRTVPQQKDILLLLIKSYGQKKSKLTSAQIDVPTEIPLPQTIRCFPCVFHTQNLKHLSEITGNDILVK